MRRLLTLTLALACNLWLLPALLVLLGYTVDEAAPRAGG